MDSSTIDPSALFDSSSGQAAPSASPNHPVRRPSGVRGLKRSRSPDSHGLHRARGTDGDEADDSKPRKRGRPPKHKGAVDSPTMSAPLNPSTPNSAAPAPSSRTNLANRLSPTHSSPPRVTPTAAKPPAVKALPTVRDHTTDQLNDQGDEYRPREKDVEGEKKVDDNGYLVDRQYRLRTFTVPNRGERLFMLATECARVLNYRDSYLLFNKNRSLYKIIANQEEKDHLIATDVLPYSYRSRQIAIVTARSMFRQFGSRVIQNGRRVKDDYWEAKAIKQGFTEEDAAGEKRPGAGRQREAAAAELRATTLASLPRGQVVYGDPVHGESQPSVPHGIDPVTFANVPGIGAFSPDTISAAQPFAHVIRPRHEVSGQAYEDQTRESSTSDVAAHASSAAEYNKLMTQQRATRETYLNDYWKRPHDTPSSPTQSIGAETPGTSLPHQIQSPQPSTMSATAAPHQMMLSHQQQQSQLAGQHGYIQQSVMASQSPQRPMHQQLPPGHGQQPSPVGLPVSAARQLTPSYSYAPGGMWPPPQPQPSPLQVPSYGQQPQQQQQQHLSQQMHSPMHPPSQLPRQPSGMTYPQMSGYGQMNRNMYQQGSPQQQSQQQQQQHYAHQQQVQQQGHPQQQQQQQQPGAQAWGQHSPAMSGPDWQRGFQ